MDDSFSSEDWEIGGLDFEIDNPSSGLNSKFELEIKSHLATTGNWFAKQYANGLQ